MTAIIIRYKDGTGIQKLAVRRINAHKYPSHWHDVSCSVIDTDKMVFVKPQDIKVKICYVAQQPQAVHDVNAGNTGTAA